MLIPLSRPDNISPHFCLEYYGGFECNQESNKEKVHTGKFVDINLCLIVFYYGDLNEC